MPQMIVKDREIIRICPKDARRIEVSTNNGGSWMTRYLGSSNQGRFLDLTDNGQELLAITEKGLFASRNNGSNWTRRS